MKLYRFSPIKNQKVLLAAIKHTHIECHKLCKQSLGHYLPIAGNIGIFCHFEDEYEHLTKLRLEMTALSDSWNQKYFRLHEPIVIAASGDIPETMYTYLYIRKPDADHNDVGDVDFYMEPEKYKKLKGSLLAGEKIIGASLFERPDLDLVRLFSPNIDACAFVGQQTITEAVTTQEPKVYDQ